MARGAIKSGQFVILNEVKYVIDCNVGGQTWQLKQVNNGRYCELAESDLHKYYLEGRLSFLTEHDRIQNKIADEKNIALNQSMALLPTRIREEAKIRYAYVSEILRSEIPSFTKKTLTPLISKIWDKVQQPEQAPNWVTVYRWCKRYQEGGKDIRALVTRNTYKGNRDRRIDKNIIEMVRESIGEIYMTRERNTIEDTVDHAIALVEKTNSHLPQSNQIPLPTYSLVRREILAIDPYEVSVARYGYQLTRNKYRYAGKGSSSEKLLERAEIDHTVLDLMVVDDETFLPLGRPTLTICIDHYSRCVLGMYLGFEPPSFSTVAQCLKHAFLPKTSIPKEYNVKSNWIPHGIMENLVVDNGLEFHGKGFEDLCYSFGIVIQYCQRATPWYKGVVERFLGSMNRGVAHGLPGTTFSNIFEKKDYDAAKNATITYSSLLEIVHIWIIDYYHNRKHAALNRPPIKVWQENSDSYPIPLPANVNDIDSLIGEVKERKVTHKGVSLNNLRYNSEELGELRRVLGAEFKAKIRYNPTNLGHIYVHYDVHRLPLKVPCLQAEYANGLSVYQHNLCIAYAKTNLKRSEIEDLAEAKQKIREIVKNDLLNKRKKTRKSSARFIENERKHTDNIESESDSKPISSIQDISKIKHPRVFKHSISTTQHLSNLNANTPDDKHGGKTNEK